MSKKVLVKLLKVSFGFFKNKQFILDEIYMDLSTIPNKHDVMCLNCGRYKVLQRDFIYSDKIDSNMKLESITLFIEKLL